MTWNIRLGLKLIFQEVRKIQFLNTFKNLNLTITKSLMMVKAFKYMCIVKMKASSIM